MKKIALLSLGIMTFSAKGVNAEYQKMLTVRENILGITEKQNPETPSSLTVLTEKEESLNIQFTELLQQLNTLTKVQ